MAQSPPLDIESLTQAIPGENPAGEPAPTGGDFRFKELRKQDPPDWNQVRTLAEESLRETSKDLEYAAYLTEALVKLRGFEGLWEGLHLLRELCQQSWNQLHPAPDKPDYLKKRASKLNWLDDDRAGA